MPIIAALGRQSDNRHMQETLNRAHLEDLLHIQNSAHCVSVYLPTDKIGARLPQDKIRFKNMLTTAASELEELGMRGPDVRKMLAPGRELLHDPDFWRHPGESMAAFFAEKKHQFFHLPLKVPEFLFVGTEFHLKPLLPLVADSEHYYVLAVALDSVAFYRCSPFHIEELHPAGLPRGIDEITEFDQVEKQIQVHSTAPKQSIFHGQMGGDEAKERKKKMAEYVRRIDQAVSKILKQDGTPLVFAGVEYLFGLYRTTASVEPLPEFIPGSPELTSKQELHQAALAIIHRQSKEREEQDYLRLKSLESANQATFKLEQGILAAYSGQVDEIYLPIDQQVWGKVEPQELRVEVHESKDREDADLLDLAAVQTWLHGGKVRLFPASQGSRYLPLAAALRYRAP